MRISRPAGRLVAAVLLITVSCGGGDDEDAATTTTSTVEVTTSTMMATTAPAIPSETATSGAPTTAATAATTTTRAKPATTTSTVPAKLSPTQFLVAKPGCRNEILYIRLGADRKVLHSKAVVKAAGNTQLIAYAERDDKLLFGAFNCDAKTTSMSEISLADPRATPKLIASDLDVVDADYDIASNAVLVLTGVGSSGAEPTVVSIDPAGTRAVRWTRPAAWRSAANPLSAVYPNRLRALTGGEMLIGGDGGGKFIVARVHTSGTMSGGVTGDGELGTFAISILQGAVALSIDRSPDLYLCAFGPVYGTGQSTPTPMTSVAGCAGHPLPRGLTSLPAKVAWAFSGQDGHNLLLVIRDQPALLDVESLDLRTGSAPPKVYGTVATDAPYGVYVVPIYELDRDLSKTAPSVTV